MKTEELKRIAKENDYELNKSLEHYKLTHKYCDNYISINGLFKNRLWISIPFFCDERDFNMIKAAVEFAETPIEDREEKTYRYEVFCEIDIKAKSKEEAIRKLEKDYGNYFSTYVGVVNEDGEVEE